MAEKVSPDIYIRRYKLQLLLGIPRHSQANFEIESLLDLPKEQPQGVCSVGLPLDSSIR